MKKSINRIKQSEFAKNVLKLFTGTVIAQLIPFIVLPFLQKYFYSPAEFAVFAAFSRFADIFMTIAVLRLEQGVVLMDSKAKQVALFKQIKKVLIAMTLFSLMIVILFNQPIERFLGVENVGTYLYVVPVMVFAFGLFQTAYFWLNKKGSFGNMAIAKVLQSVFSEGSKLSFGWMGMSVFGLILGRLAGVVAAFIYIIFPFLKMSQKQGEKSNPETEKQVYRETKDFMFFSTPSTLTKTLVAFITISLIIEYFGKDSAGNFAVSLQYIGALFAFLSAAFSQVYYNKIVKIKRRAEMMKVYTTWMLRLMIFSALVVIGVHLIPNGIVVDALGEKWSDLLPISRIVIWSLTTYFVSSSLSFIYVRLNKQKQMLFFDLGHLCLISGSIIVAHNIYGTLEAVLWTYAIAQMIFYSLTMLLATQFIRRSTLLES